MRDSNPTLARFSRFTWSLVAGVLLGWSFPPIGLYPLAWVALVPLIARWATAPTLGQVARDTYAALLLTTALVLGWVLLHPFAEKALLSGAGLLLMPLPFVAAFVLSALVRMRLGLVAGLTALVAGVVGAEWLLVQGSTPVPWLLLGHTQADAPLFNSIAALGGVPLLTLWVQSVNALFFVAVRVPATAGPIPGPRSLATLLGLAAIAAPAAYGDARVLPEPVGSVRVGLVQPAAAAAEWAAFSDGNRVDTLAQLSDFLLAGGVHAEADSHVRPASLTPPPDLLVWPEAALPVFGDAAMERRLYARLGVWAARRQTALLAGALTTSASAPAPTVTSDGAGTYYSSALLFAGGAVQEYDRMHLVPILERLPFLGSDVPREAAPPSGAARYGGGGRRALLRLDSIAFAAPIGAETLLGPHLAAFAADGARFFVAPANNGWWGPAPSAQQHLDLTRLRAIETRRAVVVATVNGVSGLLLPDGSLQQLTNAGERGLAQVEVPLYTGTTAYVRHGDRIGGPAALVAGLLGLVGLAAAGAKRAAARSPRRGARPVGMGMMRR